MIDWIMTYTGRQFFPLQPSIEDIDIEDIAHSLSMLCRYNGHSKFFYSVAEHSCRVAEILPPELALWGLLHDAAEAYLSDLPRPIKHQIPQFIDIEDRLLEVIMRKFSLPFPMPDEVKKADDILLATELRDLMPPPKINIPLPYPPLTKKITKTWNPDEAKQKFLETFRKLSNTP